MNYPPSQHDAECQQSSMLRRVDRRIAAEGKLTLPAVPALAGDYTERCARVFEALGRAFNDTEKARLREAIEGQLAAAFEASQRSSITVSYQSVIAGALSYTVTAHTPSVSEVYDEWVATRKPPYFGVEPDARVMELAHDIQDPSACRVLDLSLIHI